MKAIIQKTVEVSGRDHHSYVNEYTKINSRIITIRFLSIPVYRKEESFSD
jgi:hypothetical protein